MLNSMEQFNQEVLKEDFEIQFARRQAIDVLDGKIEAMDIGPDVLKTEVPVLLAPGWAASLEVFKDSIKILFEKNRRVLALERTEENVSENEIDEKLKRQYPMEILRNATALLRLLEEKKIDKVDAVAHSEGVDNISIAFAINPEKFRNIVFIAPPGLTGKDSFYGLAGRFSLSLMKELKKFVLSNDEKEKERIATVVEEAIKYIVKKPVRSIKEEIGISRIEIQKNLEDMQKKGVGVAVIAGVDDVVFPMDKMQKNVTKDQFDGFVSVKGVHNEIINNPEQYMAAAVELLDKLEKKKNSQN